MGNSEPQKQKRRPTPKELWQIALLVIGVIAVVQELRRPADERTWHGKVGGYIPYDFRKPTGDRFREVYWNPEGPLVSSKVWGVGWALNLGAVRRRFER